ncbi:MAG: sulfotransferase family protein [Lacipirellulaceae bacterium]
MSKAVVITGMHRSGTSMVSSVLKMAGLPIGDFLIAGNQANPRGYFEDVDFYAFHERALHRRDQSYLHVEPWFRFEPSADESADATALVAARAKRALWGWKDPRTCLFLDFWASVLVDAVFVLVYRRPIDVLMSLLRRGEFDANPQPIAGLDAWRVYNERIAAFYRANPGRCVLAEVSGLTASPGRFGELLRSKLGVNVGVTAEGFERVFRKHELRATVIPPECESVLSAVAPRVPALYDELCVFADIPPAATGSPPPANWLLGELLEFVHGVADPTAPAIREALLLLALNEVAPHDVARMFLQGAESTRKMQRTIDAVWLQVQELQSSATKQSDELSALRQELARRSEVSQRPGPEKTLLHRLWKRSA